MPQAFAIPVVPAVAQRFRVTLIDVVYTMVFRWNGVSSCWIMDLYQEDGATAVLRGRPVLTGADMLEQYTYLEIGGKLIAITVSAGVPADAVPTWTNFGAGSGLYFVTP